VSRHALPLNELKQSVAMLREKPSEADKTRTLYRSMGFESGGEYLRALVDLSKNEDMVKGLLKRYRN